MTPFKPATLGPYKPRPWMPKPGLGTPNVLEEFKRVLPEFKEAGNWALVAGGWVAGDVILHQLFPVTEGEKTPPYYYGNKLVWAIPTLLIGRLVSDYLIKGSNVVRALTIATVANTAMQVRYLTGNYTPEFNLAVFLMHELLLIPLSFLITGPSPVTGFYDGTK